METSELMVTTSSSKSDCIDMSASEEYSLVDIAAVANRSPDSDCGWGGSGMEWSEDWPASEGPCKVTMDSAV